MIKIKVSDIEWDTNDLTKNEIEGLELPDEDVIFSDSLENIITDYLSDKWDFCVESFSYEIEND